MGGGDGRIRVDAPFIDLDDVGDPNWTFGACESPVFPPSNAPTLRAILVDGQDIPADPLGGIQTSDVQIVNVEPVQLLIEATNIPLETEVKVRVVPARGQDLEFTTTPPHLQDPDGDGVLTALIEVQLPPGKSEIQLRANWVP